MKNNLSTSKSVVAIVVAIVVLAYLILPFDIIPDMALGAGQIDDIVVALIGIAVEIVTFMSKGKTNSRKKEDDFEDANYREVN